MDQQTLYNMVRSAGFKIWEFQDHPRYFGSWRATIEGRHKTFQIISDGRECWLELQRLEDGQAPKAIHGVSNQGLSDLDQVNAIHAWLIELS
jgi:hypothetical protein